MLTNGGRPDRPTGHAAAALFALRSGPPGDQDLACHAITPDDLVDAAEAMFSQHRPEQAERSHAEMIRWAVCRPMAQAVSMLM